jgi:hypothetical protein
MVMRTIFLLLAALLLSAGTTSAATMQKWTAGWDNFGEPLNYKKSKISWSVNPTKSTLSVTFKLVGATPSKLYEVGIDSYCITFPATFGQFPVVGGGGTCQPATRQGVTENIAGVDLSVVTTDMNGNGSFAVVVGPIAAGTYVLEFFANDGAGCNLIGGAGQGSDCAVDFQSPGPFGTATTITVP